MPFETMALLEFCAKLVYWMVCKNYFRHHSQSQRLAESYYHSENTK